MFRGSQESKHPPIPDSWDGVAFDQFIRIKDGMPVTAILAAIWGLDELTVKAMRFDVETSIKHLAFLKTPIPQSVWVWAPKDIEKIQVGRFEDFKDAASKLTGKPEDLEHYPILFAHYIGQQYDGDQVERLANQARGLPCGVVLGTVHQYIKQLNDVEERWGKQFPKSGYTADQEQAGFKRIDDTFKFFGTLVYVEAHTKFTRSELLDMPVHEFKFNLLHLAWVSEAHKKYAEIQANRQLSQQRRR